MKKVSRRALFALALAVVLAVGTLAFCVNYAANAENWVTFSGSRTLYRHESHRRQNLRPLRRTHPEYNGWPRVQCR
ncbi:MAG: hypothetical protein ACLTGM_09455 [Oscillospiraceae bacterium]